MKILIAYATCTGATQKIAERISTRLTSSNIAPETTTVLHPVLTQNPADFWHAASVSYNDIDISPFDAIVIGSAIQGQKWLPQAEKFIAKLKNENTVAEGTISQSEAD